MKYPKDLVGLQFGRLTVISQAPNQRWSMVRSAHL